jgi:lysophospholipase L1-like esterase
MPSHQPVALEHPIRLAIPIDDPGLLLSPYTWKFEGLGASAIAEACLPGAYLRAAFTGSSYLGLVVDGPGAMACGDGERPIVEISIDHGPFLVKQVAPSGGRYIVDLGLDIDARREHVVDIGFRAGSLHHRWHSSAPRLRLGGLLLESAGRLLPVPRRPRNAIGWGDSITEGVGADGLFTSWSELHPNRARATWFPLVASALGCEYGQLGSGGQSLTAPVPGGLPALGDSWSVFDVDGGSRLVDGRLHPPPHYIFCNHGTNDRCDPSDAYHRWLDSMQQAAPAAIVFVVVPINGFWRSEIAAVVAARRASGQLRLHLIDCPELQPMAPARGAPTSLADDGAHPTALGQGMFAAAIAVQAAAAIARETDSSARQGPGSP